MELSANSVCVLLVLLAIIGNATVCYGQEQSSSGVQLRGLSEFQQVSIKANPVGSKLFSKCRPTSFRIVQVEVANGLNTPILLDGDSATASSEKSTFQQSSQKEIIADSGCDPTAFTKSLVVAASLATAGLAAPMASEIAKRRENLGVPCGEDEVRLSVAEIRLGKRILMPGDKTTCLLCFSVPTAVEVPDSLDVKITIPVVTKAPDQVSGQVEVQTSLLK